MQFYRLVQSRPSCGSLDRINQQPNWICWEKMRILQRLFGGSLQPIGIGSYGRAHTIRVSEQSYSKTSISMVTFLKFYRTLGVFYLATNAETPYAQG